MKIRAGDTQGENPMSKIREIREAIDTKLDKWEASATAIEAQLQLPREQAVEELEARKKRLKETMEGFKSEIVKAKGLADEKKTEIQARFDELQVQLALGKAEVRDSFEAQKEKIQHSIAMLEATVDRELDAAGQSMHECLRKAANEFIVAAVKLEAEMEFLAIQFKVKKDRPRDRLQHEKRALIEQIKRYKQQLEEKRQMAKDKAATFENELSNGMSQIRQAFKKLSD
jgi:DNA polymerase III alpha subunit (gram-positive type)